MVTVWEKSKRKCKIFRLVNLYKQQLKILMFEDNNSNQFLIYLIGQNIRLDGRECFQSRNVSIYYMDKFGSLLYEQGKTQVLVKIAAEIAAPRPQRPAEGFIHFRVNCAACPHSSDKNKKNSNQITKLLEKIIIGSNALDPESLCILTGKFVWRLDVECMIIRDDGNILDSALNAVMVALMDMKKPLVNVERSSVQLGEKQIQLSIAHTPFSFTFGLIEDTVFIDPTLNEDENSETRITVSMNIYKELCSIHKPGGKGISEPILSGIIKVSENRIKEFTSEIRESLKARKSIRFSF